MLAGEGAYGSLLQVAQVLVVALLASAILHEFADAGESHKRKSTSGELSGAKRATRSTRVAHRPLSDTDPDADAKESQESGDRHSICRAPDDAASMTPLSAESCTDNNDFDSSRNSRSKPGGGRGGRTGAQGSCGGAIPAGEEAKEVDVEKGHEEDADFPPLYFDAIRGFYVPSRTTVDETSLPLHTPLMHL